MKSQNYVKNLIEKNVSLQPVRQAIKLKLIKKYATHLKDKIRIETSYERKGIVTVATIVMLILIIVLIILFRPTQQNPRE